MTETSPTERLVENLATADLASLGIACKTGFEIDDAGERADLSRFLLEGRLVAALHRLNPALPQEACEQVVKTLSRAPHPTLV